MESWKMQGISHTADDVTLHNEMSGKPLSSERTKEPTVQHSATSTIFYWLFHMSSVILTGHNREF